MGSELSGGQRSLVALSLILSLLLFKPAPLYILDEVDAALDLSHTQNIGQMLKTHFKHSQLLLSHSRMACSTTLMSCSGLNSLMECRLFPELHKHRKNKPFFSITFSILVYLNISTNE